MDKSKLEKSLYNKRGGKKTTIDISREVDPSIPLNSDAKTHHSKPLIHNKASSFRALKGRNLIDMDTPSKNGRKYRDYLSHKNTV